MNIKVNLKNKAEKEMQEVDMNDIDSITDFLCAILFNQEGEKEPTISKENLTVKDFQAFIKDGKCSNDCDNCKFDTLCTQECKKLEEEFEKSLIEVDPLTPKKVFEDKNIEDYICRNLLSSEAVKIVDCIKKKYNIDFCAALNLTICNTNQI